MRRVLVSGSREWTARTPIWNALNAELQTYGGVHLIEGGAEGADTIAENWAWGMHAMGYDIEITRLVPDYDRWGKRAPLIRNAIMARDNIDVLHAFPLEGTGGTRQCMTEAYCYRVPEIVNHGWQMATAQAIDYARTYGSILKGLNV